MTRVGLQELAQVAEVIAAAAVVISLVYVGRELRSNTSAVQGAAIQAIATTDAAALMTVASDSALSEIVRIGRSEPSKLSDADAFRYSLYMRQFWLSFQNIYQQTTLGLLDPRVWQSYRKIICDVWASPGSQSLWNQEREILEPGFVQVVESCSSP